jgi:hypothetical protein
MAACFDNFPGTLWFDIVLVECVNFFSRVIRGSELGSETSARCENPLFRRKPNFG